MKKSLAGRKKPKRGINFQVRVSAGQDATRGKEIERICQSVCVCDCERDRECVCVKMKQRQRGSKKYVCECVPRSFLTIKGSFCLLDRHSPRAVLVLSTTPVGSQLTFSFQKSSVLTKNRNHV